ncbi:MAG: indolepyruvate ferredoxin oxidoreductase family protein [Alphaproteobacteria bacterium]|nr:indolepyruvate ferredoxin oxidoreductase family protein [Alphaproteobacteria bacterium]
MAKTVISLDDRYDLDVQKLFLTGAQAITRLPMMQRRRDLAAGLNTAGYISGYRGSPLGTYDQQLVQAKRFLDEHHIVFQPGVNEDIAATAIWGTQQAHLSGEGKYDGVFGIWYGKGPGVDRSGDALRHANLAGTAPHGGVLALMGDDHTCESSTTAHQSEFALVDAMIPILNPAGVQEIIDFGLLGWALSRYSGCWVGLKCVHDTISTAVTVDTDPARIQPKIPTDFELPPGGLNIRRFEHPREQEARLQNYKIDAVRAWARANKLDRVVLNSAQARIGIVTTGKSYLDVRQALDELGIDEAGAAQLGIRLYKVAMPWPLEPHGIKDFAEGLELIIVVEEKRGLVEPQLKEILYGRANPPKIIGKADEQGAPLFRAAGALDPNHIAVVIGQRLTQRGLGARLGNRLGELQALVHEQPAPVGLVRTPYFCAGCPHNTSTRVPDGSRGYAGIGCHWLSQLMDRSTLGYTQMGGEGANWIGEARFSKRRHMFQNIGDGTYFHSGFMSIRAAIASGVNITFKVLYNDAVAMTGGQAHDGPLSVPRITQQVHAEGAKQVVVVTDEPDKYPIGTAFAPGVTIRHRDELDRVQRELRDVDGTTVIVYDQTCAAEKRRRRKRKIMGDPPKRVVINEAVFEGCGDCGVQSNCVAVAPLETEFGRKRTIDQSSCNKDFSCVKGFCPSFVTVHGGQLKRGRKAAVAAVFEALPEPTLPTLDKAYGIVVTGVGGTGVVTIGQLLGMAAHVDGKGCGVLDMTGLAQKNGAVMSHIRIAATSDDIKTVRIAAGGADLLIGCDLVVSGGPETLKALRKGTTRAIVNTHEVMTGDFTRQADLAFPTEALRDAVAQAVGPGRSEFVDATPVATGLLGDAIATNLFMLGYAYQKGHVPIAASAIERAIELNGAAVEMNKQAFVWGRRAALDFAAVQRQATPPSAAPARPRSRTLDEIVARRVAELTAYQDAAYAARYRALVERVRAAEASAAKGMSGLAEAVARYYFKLLAYKDEYEVARLYTDGAFLESVKDRFEGDYRLEFHLAPPLLADVDPETGRPRKRGYGPWMLTAFRVLARLRRLRGTRLDVFGYTAERKLERRLIADYERAIDKLLQRLSPQNHALAVEIASLPEHIRGFGHVKQRHLADTEKREGELWSAFERGGAAAVAAE